VGRFNRREVIPYYISQYLGALLATGLLIMIMPTGKSYAATIPHVSTAQAVIWEVILTFFVMLAIMGVATDKKSERALGGFVVGAAVVLVAWVGGPITGASMNPARSLGPCLAEGRFDIFWIYLVGPHLGAILAALVYENLREAE
jgi:aquaporin NIP